LAQKNREKSGFFSNFSKPERFLRGLSLIAEHSRIPRNVFFENFPHTVYNAIASGYALIQRKKTAKKVYFFKFFKIGAVFAEAVPD
jgi:hypothetical protein